MAVVGKSDSGKTTLIERLLPELLRLGLRVATVKHDAHSFDIDHPGKDSYRHGAAGAEAYVVSSPTRVAYVGALDQELSLPDIVDASSADMDLVVAEGYKRSAPHPRRDLPPGGRPCGAAVRARRVARPGHRLRTCTHPHRFALDDGAGLAAFLARRLDSLREY